MADSDMVSGIGGAVSGIAGMVPGIGTAVGAGVGAITSIISGIMKGNEAKEQAARAAELRRKSELTQKMALRPEYIKSLKMNEMAALYGIPAMNQYTEDIDANVANNARAILESSADGGTALNAINATLNKSYGAKNQLYAQDAVAREQKMAKVADQVSGLGDKQMDLVAMQRADKRDLNTAAGNLENSATANKVGSMDQILTTIGGIGNTIGKVADGSGQNIPAQGLTLKDGTQVDAQTLAAIMATLKKGGGNVLPYKFQ